jgi:hypothetical protein
MASAPGISAFRPPVIIATRFSLVPSVGGAAEVVLRRERPTPGITEWRARLPEQVVRTIDESGSRETSPHTDNPQFERLNSMKSQNQLIANGKRRFALEPNPACRNIAHFARVQSFTELNRCFLVNVPAGHPASFTAMAIEVAHVRLPSR